MPGHVRLDPAPERPIADDDQARLRNPHAHRAISPQKVAQALALLEPADEEHVQAFVAQMADRRETRPVDADVYAVGNHTHREGREVALHKCARRLAYSDRPVQVLEVRLEQRPAVEIADIGSRERMKSPDVGSVRHPEHRDRKRRHQRLMEMKDIEFFLH